MTGLRFGYRFDKTCRIVTWSVAGGILLAGGLLWWLSPGEYLPVWFLFIALSLVLLALLSVPRSIRLTRDAVEITHIPWRHIRSARRVDRASLRPLWPLFASPGFFGWTGYWLDAKGWDVVKVYATSWQGLVVIEDIYEQRYVVNSDDPDGLCEKINEMVGKLANFY